MKTPLVLLALTLAFVGTEITLAADNFTRRALYEVNQPNKETIHCKKNDWVKLTGSTPETVLDPNVKQELVVKSDSKKYVVRARNVESKKREEGGKTYVQNTYTFYVELTLANAPGVDPISIEVDDGNGKITLSQDFMAH